MQPYLVEGIGNHFLQKEFSCLLHLIVVLFHKKKTYNEIQYKIKILCTSSVFFLICCSNDQMQCCRIFMYLVTKADKDRIRGNQTPEPFSVRRKR